MSIDNRLLVILAIIIFILDFILNTFFHRNSGGLGTFIGLMLLSTAVIGLIDGKN